MCIRDRGAVLFGQSMTYNADEPKWINRDRFVLSAGHGSMFLYSWLHLAGYDIPKDEVANFRQHHSATPGHPEFPNSEHTTPGIEATTGPLGAGISNCAGLAAASKMSAAAAGLRRRGERGGRWPPNRRIKCAELLLDRLPQAADHW